MFEMQAVQARQGGVKLLGYFYWAICDSFEWAQGNTNTFGLVHVDFDSDSRPRAAKDSLACKTLWHCSDVVFTDNVVRMLCGPEDCICQSAVALAVRVASRLDIQGSMLSVVQSLHDGCSLSM